MILLKFIAYLAFPCIPYEDLLELLSFGIRLIKSLLNFTEELRRQLFLLEVSLQTLDRTAIVLLLNCHDPKTLQLSHELKRSDRWLIQYLSELFRR